MTLHIAPLTDVGSLNDLARDAEQDGYRMVSRLISDWQHGTNRFDGPGETLYVVSADGGVVGVGGLNVDPFIETGGVGRVRRLYVSSQLRRRGIGSTLVEQIVQDAKTSFELLRLRTFDERAAAFYRACGFEDVHGDDTCTHQLALTHR